MMCPPDYRLPEMQGSAREVFGGILKIHATELQDDLIKAKSQFEAAERSRDTCKKSNDSLPNSLLPEVEEKTWNLWNSIFDQVNSDGDTMITITELEASGLLSYTASSALAGIIDSDVKHGF